MWDTRASQRVGDQVGQCGARLVYFGLRHRQMDEWIEKRNKMDGWRGGCIVWMVEWTLPQLTWKLLPPDLRPVPSRQSGLGSRAGEERPPDRPIDPSGTAQLWLNAWFVYEFFLCPSRM